jgi:hypothetical protein
MRIRYFYFIILLLITVFLSQNNAQLSVGLIFEPFKITGDFNTPSISTTGGSAFVCYQVDSTKSISLRIGFYAKNMDARIFAGTQYSILGEYKLNRKIFSLIGLSLYENNATSSMSGRITNKSVMFINAGIGINPIDWFKNEIILLLPVGNREVATVKFFYDQISHYHVDYILKVNFVFVLKL